MTVRNTENRIPVLRSIFAGAANGEKSQHMEAYMKGVFPFYGLQQAERKALSSEWLKEIKPLSMEEKWTVILALWAEDYREMQYVALDILKGMHQSLLSSDLARIETLILEKSWWDTVDALAGHTCGAWLREYPEQKSKVVNRWSESGELWLIRCALLFQLFYKTETDEELLFSLCDRFCREKEFFIRKGIGWALRQYAKTEPEQVCAYVKSNPQLSGLSRREALKHLKDCMKF